MCNFGEVNVNGEEVRTPLLVVWYERFLSDHDAQAFAHAASLRYTSGSLERLLMFGDRYARRAAVLALGMVGDYSSNTVVGNALVDRDRGVRTLAENSIRNLWLRVGTPQQRSALRKIVDLNRHKDHHAAVDLATKLIHDCPWIAEAWCQRGTAYFHRGQYELAIRDCNQALEINPYHFTAAAGIGQCFLLMNNMTAALDAFRRALRLNPSMEEVRAQVVKLQKSAQED
jgi:tetratricopeptide (TPR) repeat protein